MTEPDSPSGRGTRASATLLKVTLIFAVAALLGVRIGTGSASIVEIVAVTLVAWIAFRVISRLAASGRE